MVMIGIAVIVALVLCVLAVRANRRFRDHDRLPMQWWLDGRPTWSAPRPLALAFMPVLAVCVLAINATLALTQPTHPGQEWMVLPMMLGIGATLIAIQLIHIWLIGMTVRERDG